MICLMVSQSRFCVATLVVYVCVLIPLRQLRTALADLIMDLTFLLAPERATGHPVQLEPILPVCRFEDAQCSGASECAICLSDFGGEDSVSELAGCGHVFHAKCIGAWVGCNRFTCPLCRASVRNGDENSHAKNSTVHDLNPYIPSSLAFSWH